MAAVARAAFGPGRRPEAMQRLRGGSKKGVYRLPFDDETSVIGYVWDAAENYWPDRHDGDSAVGDDNPFSAASGTGLFETAHARLGSALQVMHHHRSPIFGRPAADGGGVGIAPLAGAPAPGGGQGSCEHIVLDRALADLADAAGRVGRIAAARGPLEQAVRGFAAEVQPRIKYGLIQASWGPTMCSSTSTGTRS